MRFGDPTLDPDLIDLWLAQLSVRTNSMADAYWWLLIEYDYDEFIKVRRTMVTFLARYGRQSLLQWADVEVTEIAAYFETLCEMMKSESVTERLSDT